MRRIEYANIKMANCWEEKNILLIVVVIIFVTKTITSEVNKINCKTNTKTGINKKIKKNKHTHGKQARVNIISVCISKRVREKETNTYIEQVGKQIW